MSFSDYVNDLVILACAVSLIVASYYLSKILHSIDRVSKNMLQFQHFEEGKTCTACHKAVEENFLYCVYCGTQRLKRCAFCKSYMMLDAKYCPQCRAKMWLNGEEKEQIV
jgi:RNA polymerase subunit RPABC4/transcription elongation factor Spt4